MACLEMYNSEQQHKGHHCPPMNPRISFSNDFVDSQQQIIKQERSSSRSEAPASTDFEFSVTNYSMMSADELFFKGRLLPFKDSNASGNQMQRTIRDALLADDDDDDDDDDNEDGVSLRPPKGSSTRWKGLLGLKRSRIGSSKKVEKSTSTSTSTTGHHGIAEERTAAGHHRDSSKKFSFVLHEDMQVSKTSQELVNDQEGSSCGVVEIGI